MQHQPGQGVVSKEEAVALANVVKLDLKKFNIKWWKYGLQSELDTLQVLLRSGSVSLSEHADVKQLAASVAYERIIRFPDYYERLKRMDDEMIIYWRNLQ